MYKKRNRFITRNISRLKNEILFITPESVVKFRFKLLLCILAIITLFKLFDIFIDNYTSIIMLILIWNGINIIYSNLIKSKDYSDNIEFFSVIIDILFCSLLIAISGTLETPLYLLYLFIIFYTSFKYNRIGAIIFLSIIVISYYSLIRIFENWSSISINRTNEFIKILTFIFIFLMFEMAKKFKDKAQNLNKVIAQKNNELLMVKKNLEIINRELEYKNIRYKDMMSFITHELKNPLTSITSLSDLYINSENENLTSEQMQSLNVIHRNAINMEKMINDYLNLNRLDRGDIEPKYETVAVLEDIILPLIEELQNELNEHRIEIKNETPLLFENHKVITDRQFLKIIYSNLFKNAIKYGYKDSIIYYGIQSTGIEKRYYVKNKGKSIPESNYETIFEKFERLERDTKKEGSGLGLYNCKKIINNLNGDIFVESSEIYETTTFYFNIGKQN